MSVPTTAAPFPTPASMRALMERYLADLLSLNWSPRTIEHRRHWLLQFIAWYTELEGGADMRSIQTLLGHKNLSTTAITTRRSSTKELALRLLASLY